ncbi:hypothetical protein ACH5RR_025789 [Cinchona calisaya]|uniref:Reverse transcriptase zinc-binding domain-containing protein n=1 Tax=Cinchona calisaya TaxID=153742 RepID=A0ABD2Z0M5_9GENT
MPSRLKIFLWLACQNRLSTKFLLCSRNIVSNSVCSFCGHQMEDTEHILRRCPKAVSLWQSLGFSAFSAFNSSLSFVDWLKFRCFKSTGASNRMIPWPILFSFVCWGLWTNHNKSLFSPNYRPVNLADF